MSLRDSSFLDRTKSPLHVHVAESTPVHVHVKKRGRSSNASTAKSLRSSSAMSSSYQRPTASSSQKLRTSKPAQPTWIPPPGKSATGSLSWQGPTHRLEVHRPLSPTKGLAETAGHNGTVLRLSDLSDSDSDVVRACERKIDSLMSEVGSLKNEVDLQRSLKHAQRTEEQLDRSRRHLAEKETALQVAREELLDATLESARLRRSMNGLEVSAHRHKREGDELLRKLLEVELDGAAAAQQASELKRTVALLEADKRASVVMNAELERKKDDLVRRLTDFDINNKSLRRMLRTQQKREELALETQSSMERRISSLESTAIDLRSQLRDRIDEIANLKANLDTQKDQAEVMRQLRDSAETARKHLQDVITNKDQDISRKTGRLTSVEADLAHERSESDYLRKTLSDTKDRLQQEKDALKKATKHHKQRASDNGTALEMANVSLAQKNAEISELTRQCDQIRSQLNRVTRDKTGLETELTSIRSRLGERDSELLSTQQSSRATSDGLSMQLSAKSHQVTSLQAENDRLKDTVTSMEQRLEVMDTSSSSKNSANQAEIGQLRGSIKQYESLISEYKVQLEKCRRDVEDAHSQLHSQDDESRRLQQSTTLEMEKVRTQLQTRIHELEALPDVLKSTESRLRETQERLIASERQNNEHLRQIGDLTTRVESQSDQGDSLRTKWQSVLQENRSTISRAEQAERRLLESERRTTELMELLAKKEEALQKGQGRIDEIARERSMTTQQFETSLSESRHKNEQLKDRLSAKERVQKARIDELELKLQRSAAQVAQLQSENEDAERRLNNKVFDLQDRLDQEKHNNRSMENYVSYLKASYSNVFGDSTIGAGAAYSGRGSSLGSSFSSPKKVR
ncbi:outer dense fiber protein 2-like [Sycon ciliatum]|uniref:outer dense fiber protein 2-like n=1 Tax=Sycon ciliatum TaxID=27933 RepID=UPI0020AB8355|eukprot:scpid26113/ scgid3824/ Outer dense fiber protein 2; Cenexin; Outer dense fiber of sperm tails protein 2